MNIRIWICRCRWPPLPPTTHISVHMCLDSSWSRFYVISMFVCGRWSADRFPYFVKYTRFSTSELCNEMGSLQPFVALSSTAYVARSLVPQSRIEVSRNHRVLRRGNRRIMLCALTPTTKLPFVCYVLWATHTHIFAIFISLFNIEIQIRCVLFVKSQ